MKKMIILICLLVFPVITTADSLSEEGDLVVDKIRTSKIPSGLGAYKPNYFLFTRSSFDENRKKEEVKYQLSFKQRVYPWGELENEHKRYKMFFGFTLKSFWQIFDRDNSSPFRETNYNPEFFVQSPEFKSKYGIWTLGAGVEHESNGQTLPKSKSWDRIYIKPRVEYGIFTMDYKLWHRFSEEEKIDEWDTEGDDNPDINKYYGQSELCLWLDFWKLKGGQDAIGKRIINFDKSSIIILLRYNGSEANGAAQVDYFVPLINGMSLYLQYWNGYGESLIDYKQSLIKYGIGIALTK